MNAQTDQGASMPIEGCLVSERHCKSRLVEVMTLDDGWQKITGWSTYRGEADLHLANEKRLRGIMRQDRVVARSSTLLHHGDHWCTSRGDWA